jgi:hypothetical protein
VQQAGRKVLPPAYGTDLGGVFKAGKNLVLQSALWYLWLDQEFVYVGDEGVVEPGGQTRRFGLDLSARYAVLKNLFADIDVSLANPKALQVPKGRKLPAAGAALYFRRRPYVPAGAGLERQPAVPLYGSPAGE